MNLFKTVLLIDDNFHDNFFHGIAVKKTNCAREVVAIQKPEEALTYFISLAENHSSFPELIFLDINMPKMSGFELLEQLKVHNINLEKHSKVVMMTTSLNPADEKRAKQFKEIVLFGNKPLTENLLKKIIIDHFSENKIITDQFAIDSRD